jgi:predicted Zn-ribbon and HTH transcriptional regulator
VTTISEVATAVTAAIGLSKELINVDKALHEAEFKLKIAELTSALAGAKVGLAEVEDQLRAKDKEIERLSTFNLDLSGKITKSGFFMDPFDDGSPKGDPYCPYCVERKAGLFRLRHLHKPGRPSGCPHCKNEFANAPHYLYERQPR